MKSKKALLEKIYDRDTISQAYIINISIDNYNDIFNDLDPAPFKNRDLDPDLRIYLDDCSIDIPLKNKVILNFNSPKEIQDEKKEKRVIIGLKTYFQFIKRSYKREISQSYKKIMVYIIISFILLLISSYFSSILPTDFIYVTLIEGLYIGGWVFLWEAIALFVFKNREVLLKVYLRSCL